MTTLYPSSDHCFQRGNQAGFLNMTITPLYLSGLWDAVEQEIHIIHLHPTNLQLLHDGMVLIWTKISGECQQYLRIKAALKAK